ncbi:hypothetical protein PN499_25845 [Kamptonema animale CS-326]|jgi:hypothetical protein|uniref:hypothetical protein n=1 Tax=Kamptonema animale TaxID=92934 RepID=UPI00232B13A5|nr:hypothetical protein [Kamptonema animale]MDB9514628.1 hypothetical protein [Kamptonema animale CS-326]
MSGASERIEREIGVLEEAIANIGSELANSYSGYLNALGQAASQQLILACYYLCTQGYPEPFLKLSYNQRQKMQQSLRKLGIAASEKLQLLLKEEQGEEEEDDDEDEEEGWEEEENNQFTESEGDAGREEIFSQPETQNPVRVAYPQDLAVEAQGSNFKTQNSKIPSPHSADKLLQWQEKMEKAIANILRSLSRDSNRLLQNSGILPKQLPEPILEAAVNADTSGDAIAGPPNLLNLIIETVESEDEESLGELGVGSFGGLGGAPSANAVHITAINLRLSEIEFANADVTAWRQQIRNLSLRLNTVRRDYQKKQREYTVVAAESAWRACWFEG